MERARQVLKDHIQAGVTPGATAVVVVGDRISQTFAEGRHTYDPDSPVVRVDDRYDLASLTKLVTTTACLLLEADGKLSLDEPVIKWVLDFIRDGREKVTVRHLLAHCSGLPAHRSLFETCRTPDDALEAVCRTPLESTPGTATVYSDLGFILLGAVLERASGITIDSVARERVLEPLGMRQTGYRPASDQLSRIPPTEAHGKVLLHGVVHDDNTRAIGGVAPHAGLFGPGTDLARLVMAYLNEGRVDSEQVLPADGVRRYVERANLEEGSSRALGWDTVSESGSSTGKRFSTRSFGHLGFTGTSVWADPEQQLGVVLLTNRVHPTRENDGIRRLRPEFHDAVVEEIM